MSRLNQGLNSLFIHVPKAAGCSMSSVPWNKGNGHNTVSDFEAAGQLHPGLFVWAFVRNPWDRLAAAYEDCPEVWEEAPTFKSFVEKLRASWSQVLDLKSVRFTKTPRLLSVGRIHFLPMHLLLRDSKGNLRPDYVGKVESLPASWDTLCITLGVDPVKLPRHNSRQAKASRRFTPTAALYDDRLANMVGDMFKADAELWGYTWPMI